MRNAEREIGAQYKEYEAQEERKKREEIKKICRTKVWRKNI